MEFEFSKEEQAFATEVAEFLQQVHSDDVMQPWKENFTQLVDTLVDQMQHIFPEMGTRREAIKETLKGDDLAFTRLMYCTKSIEWAQEEEIRFFSNHTYVFTY